MKITHLGKKGWFDTYKIENGSRGITPLGQDLGATAHHTQSYTRMNAVTLQKLNQTGAVPVRDVKECFCSTWPAQDPR